MRSQAKKISRRSAELSVLNLDGFSTDYLLAGLDTFNIGMGICNRHLRYEAVNQTLAKIHQLPRDAHEH